MVAVIAWLLLLMVLAVPVLTAWDAIVALLVRPFGIRVPLLIWRKDYKEAIRRMSRGQYILVVGVLGWGIGVQLLITATRYAEFRFKLFDPVPETLGDFVVELIGFMLVGIFFGWMMWRQSSPDHDPFAGNDALNINPKPRS
jgi:hypothetical protein